MRAGWQGRVLNSSSQPHSYTLFLTILSFKVCEAEFRALGGDQDLPVQSEDHGLVLHVDHAAHHVPSMPTAPKQPAAHVQAVALCTVQTQGIPYGIHTM